MNQPKRVRQFGPLTYSVLAISIVLVVLVRVPLLIPSDSFQIAERIFWAIVVYLPVTLVWFVGIFATARRWALHPQVSGCALLGMGGLIMVGVASYVSDLWLAPKFIRGGSWSPSAIMAIFLLQAVVTSILKAGCWVLLFAAILGWRNGTKA